MFNFSTTEDSKTPNIIGCQWKEDKWVAVTDSLDSCNAVPAANMTATEIEEKEKTMFDFDNPERGYLDRRVENEYYEHEAKLRKHFKISEEEPKTVGELIKRIKEGDYDIRNAEHRYHSAYGMIIWRKPGEKPDHDGYDAALKVLMTAKQTARDVIMTGDPAQGLTALNEFKNATFH